MNPPDSLSSAAYNDLPNLRRVKPLPRLKRRKTDVSPSSPASPLDSYDPIATHRNPITSRHLNATSLGDQGGIVNKSGAPLPATAHAPVDPTLPNETVDANAPRDQFPLPPYYYPFFSDTPSSAGRTRGSDYESSNTTWYPSIGHSFGTFTSSYISSGPMLGQHSPGITFNLSLSMGASLGMLGVLSSTSSDEEDHQEVDYADARDRDRQGNTKKRKVPATHQRGRLGVDDGSPERAGPEDELTGRRGAAGEAFGTTGTEDKADVEKRKPLMALNVAIRRMKKKLSPATLAGLRAKELLRIRKRQLAVVLGPLALVDSFALDQALATRLPWHGALGKNPEDAAFADEKVKKAKHRRPLKPPATGGGEQQHANQCDFAFSVPSLTTERVIATREEVSLIRSRFETELAKQAQKLSESARKAASAAATAEARKSKRGGVNAQRKKPAVVEAHSGASTPSQEIPGGQDGNNGGAQNKSRNPKKKKRSALANASNPHHLRNYVPSRIPFSNGGVTALTPAQVALNAQNSIGPLPLRFLSADLPPRRRKDRSRDAPQPASTVPVTAPVDEWICSFCEYALFYGSDAEYRRAVRSRKKVLGRRRRARERAAAAASGQGSAVNGNSGLYNDETDEDPIEDQLARFVDPKVVDERVEATMKGMREKG